MKKTLLLVFLLPLFASYHNSDEEFDYIDSLKAGLIGEWAYHSYFRGINDSIVYYAYLNFCEDNTVESIYSWAKYSEGEFIDSTQDTVQGTYSIDQEDKSITTSVPVGFYHDYYIKVRALTNERLELIAYKNKSNQSYVVLAQDFRKVLDGRNIMR